MFKTSSALMIATLLTPPALMAQPQKSTATVLEAQQPRAVSVQRGPVVDGVTDKAGRRLTLKETSPLSSSLARVDSRIQNRVNARLVTRLDRGQVAVVDTTASFKTAEANSRRSNRPR